jgi:hypothetical protein
VSYPPNDGSQWDDYDWESWRLYGYGPEDNPPNDED